MPTAATPTSFNWGRTLLFCPGDRPDRFDKAVGSGADTVILDLEDAVDPARRPAARQAVALYLTSHPDATIAVRCNQVGSDDFERDIEALADVDIPALVLPKVSNWSAMQAILRQSFAGATMPAICATVESAKGAFQLASLVGDNETFEAVSWGPFDLAADMGIRHVRRSDGTLAEPLSAIRSQLLLAAAAHGFIALDTVSVRYDDLDIVAAEAAEAAALGFVGKFAIHPRQIEIIDRAMSPDPTEIARALEIISVARQSGLGASPLNGQMLDEAIYRRARNLLAAAGQPVAAE